MFLKNKKIVLGLLIIFFGFILLLNNFRIINVNNEFWWGVAFAGLGIVFLNVYFQNSNKKGPLIVSIILLIFGFLTIFDSLNFISNNIIGAIVLWGVTAIFISFYVRNNEQWWAIIPAGAFFLFGFLILLEEYRILDNDYFGFIFLFGMSLVFWFLYLVREDTAKFGWSQVIALILMLVSFFVLSEEFNYQTTDILFPVSVILCGGYLIFKGLR